MEDRQSYVRRRQRELEAERRRVEDKEWLDTNLRRLNTSEGAKFAAGVAGHGVGLIGGVGRGVYNDAKAVKDGAVFLYDVANPFSDRQAAALQTGRDVIRGGVDYASSRIQDPNLVRNDFEQMKAQWKRDLVPGSTPVASTAGGEFMRHLNYGANQGEAAYTVASLALPVAGELKGAVQFGRLAGKGPAKYVEMGATAGQAERFSLPYKGLNHHAYIPRNATWAKVPGVKEVATRLGVPDAKLNAKVPKWIVESPFNVMSSKGETGLFYKRHVGADKDFNGGKVGRQYGGAVWNGQGFGWKKFNPVEKFWHGMPDATKAVLVGAPVSLGALGGATRNDKRPR